MKKWQIHQDRYVDNPTLYSYSITLNEKYGGWETDSGQDSYGLPKELAQWICDILNTSEKVCPFDMSKYGDWIKENI